MLHSQNSTSITLALIRPGSKDLEPYCPICRVLHFLLYPKGRATASTTLACHLLLPHLLLSSLATFPLPSHARLQELKAASVYAAEAAAAVAAPASDINQAASAAAAGSVAATGPAEAGLLEAQDTEDAETTELPVNGTTKSPLQKVRWPAGLLTVRHLSRYGWLLHLCLTI